MIIDSDLDLKSVIWIIFVIRFISEMIRIIYIICMNWELNWVLLLCFLSFFDCECLVVVILNLFVICEIGGEVMYVWKWDMVKELLGKVSRI